MPGGKLLQRFHFGEIFGRRYPLRKRQRCEARSGGERLAPTVFPREETASQREVGELPEAVLLTGGDDVSFGGAIEQTPLVLCRNEGGPPMRLCCGGRLRDLHRREVGAAECADFALTDQLV